MSKDFSPIASAIIGALLPFVNESDKQGLNAVFAIAKGSLADATEKMQEITSGEDSAPANTVWALATCGDFFIPFDERIHGMTKDEDKNDIPKILATGKFGKKRNVPPKDITKIEGELVDQYGKDKTEFELGDDGQPVAIAGETTEPKRPGGKPARPGGKPQDEDRKAALELINVLTKDYGVNYDFIVEQLLSEHGVDSFQDLAPEFNKTVHRDVKAWVDFLKLITELENWFKEMDGKHHETSHEQFEDLLTEYDVNSVSELARDQLSAFHDSVDGLKGEWSTFFGG